MSELPFITVLAMNFNICLFLHVVTFAPQGEELVTFSVRKVIENNNVCFQVDKHKVKCYPKCIKVNNPWVLRVSVHVLYKWTD